LSIPMYVKRQTANTTSNGADEPASLKQAWEVWQSDGRAFWLELDALVETLDGLVKNEDLV